MDPTAITTSPFDPRTSRLGNPSSTPSTSSGQRTQNQMTKATGTNNFVTKLYNMINDPKSQHLVSWTEQGTSFVVSNVGEFGKNVLGSHFKYYNNASPLFSSFVRQLNMYGFHKINRTPRAKRTSTASQTWEFSHPKFLRGRADLLEAIKRKAMEPDPRERNRVELPDIPMQLLSEFRAENSALWQETPDQTVAKELNATYPLVRSPPVSQGSSSSYHTALSHPYPASGAVGQEGESSSLSAVTQPPDLTPHIIRINDQYSAGGGFGDIYRCRCLIYPAPSEVAVKAFRFSFAMEGDAKDKSIKMLRRELGIWRRLKHPNIVPFLGIAYGFGMEGSMSLVSLWMPNESLHKFIDKHGDNLGAEHRLRLLLDVAKGLNYLHAFPIIHGDLNCNNVLLDAYYTARLVDFGYASLMGNIPEAWAYLQRSTVRPGALRWVAPEQVCPDEEFNRTTKSDIYSFGCVALQVLSGKQPWSEVREDVAVVLCLAKGQKPGRPQSRTLEDAHWDFIQRCWSPVEERPHVDGIISAVQEFTSRFPQQPPLCDAIRSWSSLGDSGADGPSSLGQDISGGSRSPGDDDRDDRHRSDRTRESDQLASRVYKRQRSVSLDADMPRKRAAIYPFYPSDESS